jgi:hypothetical protein
MEKNMGSILIKNLIAKLANSELLLEMKRKKQNKNDPLTEYLSKYKLDNL